jgi:prevent-host-death family protein
MAVTASSLRQNIYKILDQVLETNKPVEIDRKGRKLYIVPAEKPDTLARIKTQNIMKCDPEAYVHLDWSKEWKP